MEKRPVQALVATLNWVQLLVGLVFFWTPLNTALHWLFNWFVSDDASTCHGPPELKV